MLKLIHMFLTKTLHKLNNRNTRLFPKFSTFSKILVLLLFIITSFLVNHTSNAQGATDIPRDVILNYPQNNIFKRYSQNYQSNEPNLENWVKANMESIVMSSVEATGGVDGIATLIEDPNAPFVAGGALGVTTNLAATLYTPPASGLEYLAQLKDNFLGKPAYAAQGIGFLGLQPLVPLWRGFRNIVYVFSSLIFVTMGLFIMFRIKTSPQTTLTIQSAIPKIFTTLILVTFSYAIAGLLIDLMNLFQGISLAALFNATGTKFTENLFEGSTLTTIMEELLQKLGLDYNASNFSMLSSGSAWQTMKLLSLALPDGTKLLLNGLLLSALLFFVNPVLAGQATVAVTIGGVIIILILQIIVLITLIGFVFKLLKVYLNVILKVIIAPLEIAMGAFPNSKIGFSSWIMGLISNLAVFPLSFLFLVLINLIISQIGDGAADTPSLWTPKILSGAGIAASMTRASIGFAGILLLGKLPDMIPEFIFQIKPSPWGSAIGETTKGLSAGAIFGKVAAINKTTRDLSDTQKTWRDWRNIVRRKPGKITKAADTETYSTDPNKQDRSYENESLDSPDETL